MRTTTRRRWQRAAATTLFEHHDNQARLRGEPDQLRNALKCRSRAHFEAQIQAGTREGWLQAEPLTVDLDLLEQHLSPPPPSASQQAAAAADLAELARHGIDFDGHHLHTNGQPVTLTTVRDLFGLSSLGSAQWRLDRIRATHHSPTPHPEPTQPAAPTTEAAGAGLAERILTQLETETDPDTRRHLAAALTATLTSGPAVSRTAPRTSTERDTVREPVATIRDTHTRSEPEQEPEPVPVPREHAANPNARSRTDRGLTTTPHWDYQHLETLLQPLQTRVGAIGPKARNALMTWEPDLVAHAITELCTWIDRGFELTNPTGYLLTAANAGYLTLFPLQTPTPPEPVDPNQIWAERATQVPPQVCLDLIDAALGPAPGRSYDPDAYNAALQAATNANPDLATHLAGAGR